jgi:hypothetical protein
LRRVAWPEKPENPNLLATGLFARPLRRAGGRETVRRGL